MSKYLDSVGLAHLWQKLKTYIDEQIKNNSGSSNKEWERILNTSESLEGSPNYMSYYFDSGNLMNLDLLCFKFDSVGTNSAISQAYVLYNTKKTSYNLIVPGNSADTTYLVNLHINSNYFTCRDMYNLSGTRIRKINGGFEVYVKRGPQIPDDVGGGGIN